MRFLIDASPDARHAVHLRSLGHDVTRVGTDYPAAMKDIDILALAYREQRIEAVLADYEDQLDQFLVVTIDAIRVRRSDEP